jgi:phage shock protein E
MRSLTLSASGIFTVGLVLAILFCVSCAKKETGLGSTLSDPNKVIIDVRTAFEVEQGAIPSSIHIPHTEIKKKIAGHISNKETPIILYCKAGGRAQFAKNILLEMGYKKVVNGGGFKALQKRIQQL